MQHLPRQQFELDLLDAVAEVCAGPEIAVRRAALAARIKGLVDALLLTDQPIVSAEVTVLLADLRGFTALCDSAPPGLVIELLNRYYRTMSEQIVAHGGLIDKFMGDAVLALFGAPVGHDDDLHRAVTCAVRMQQAMRHLNAQGAARGEPPLYAGIAVATGPVMVGSFGCEWHSEYTATGEAVNLASRIEAYSLRGQVLLSEASRRAATGLVEIGRVNEVLPKGKLAPIRLHEVKAVRVPEHLQVPDIEPRRSPRIRVDIPLRLQRVDDKKVRYECLTGRVQDLGYNGMSADLPVSLPACAEVVVALDPPAFERGIGDLYARVLRTRRIHGQYRTSLEFTSVGAPAQQVIKRYVDDQLWGR